MILNKSLKNKIIGVLIFMVFLLIFVVPHYYSWKIKNSLESNQRLMQEGIEYNDLNQCNAINSKLFPELKDVCYKAVVGYIASTEECDQIVEQYLEYCLNITKIKKINFLREHDPPKAKGKYDLDSGDIKFYENIKEYGIDIDNNGKYEYLVYSFPLIVPEDKEYKFILGIWSSKNHDSSHKIVQQYFNKGENVINFSISAKHDLPDLDNTKHTFNIRAYNKYSNEDTHLANRLLWIEFGSIGPFTNIELYHPEDSYVVLPSYIDLSKNLKNFLYGFFIFGCVLSVYFLFIRGTEREILKKFKNKLVSRKIEGKYPKIIQTFKDSFYIIKKNWKVFLIYGILLLIPTFYMLSQYDFSAVNEKNIEKSIYSTVAFSHPSPLSEKNVLRSGFLFFIWFILSLVYFLFPLILICVISDTYNKVRINYIKYFQKLKKKVFWFFTTSLLYNILVLAGTLLLIIPGIIISVIFVFYKQVVVLKDKRHMKALDYSEKLVKERGWKVFGLLTLFSIIGMFTIKRFSIVPYIISPTILYYIITEILSALISIITITFWTVYFVKLDQFVNKKKGEKEGK